MNTVLVVDDDEKTLRLIRDALELHSFTVRTAVRGGEALEGVHKELPDLVLLDVQLPDVNGVDMLTRLREAGVHAPIVAVTARAMPGDEAALLAAGFDGYLSKPLSLGRLLEAVTRLLKTQA